MDFIQFLNDSHIRIQWKMFCPSEYKQYPYGIHVSRVLQCVCVNTKNKKLLRALFLCEMMRATMLFVFELLYSINACICLQVGNPVTFVVKRDFHESDSLGNRVALEVGTEVPLDCLSEGLLFDDLLVFLYSNNNILTKRIHKISRSS